LKRDSIQRDSKGAEVNKKGNLRVKEARRKWGVESGEWGQGTCLPIPFSATFLLLLPLFLLPSLLDFVHFVMPALAPASQNGQSQRHFSIS
jgi:hypothetical protein